VTWGTYWRSGPRVRDFKVHWVGQLCFFTSEKEQPQVPVLVSVIDVALEQNSGSLGYTYVIGTLGTSVGNEKYPNIFKQCSGSLVFGTPRILGS
jgi:hypothetical protein